MILSSLKSAASSAASSMSKRAAHQLEIRPTQDFVVYRGDPDTTAGLKLRGYVALGTSEELRTRGVRIVFEGMRRTYYHPETGPKTASNFIVNKNKFFWQEHHITESGQGIKNVSRGSHEWPFEFDLPGDLPESIEGMHNSYVAYNLRVVVDRGAWAKDLIEEKHMRVIRTLAQESMDLMEVYSVPDVWPDKVQYNFTVPSQTIVYGTTLFTDVELIPLREKLSFTRVETEIVEIVKIRRAPIHTIHREQYNFSRSQETVVKEETQITSSDSDEIDPDTQMPVIRLKLRTPLPRSLKKCRQDVHHNQWIVIKHHVYHSVFIQNPPSEQYPDGHESSLRVNHPLFIFISPNLLFGENDELSSMDNERFDHDSNLVRAMQAAPPIYETHRLDPLFEDVDTSGYFTPGPWSGAQTPYGSFSISRRGSSENLSALSSTTPPSAPYHHYSPNHLYAGQTGPSALALERRLSNLQNNDTRENHQQQQHHHHHHNNNSSPPGGAAAAAASARRYFESSARASDHQHARGPEQIEPSEHVEYDMEALEHRPSYETAVRTEATSSFSVQPPTYGEVMSQPPSPS